MTYFAIKQFRENKPINPGNIRIALGGLLYMIRFPIMDAEMFNDGPRQSDILSDDVSEIL